ncbi:MAG: efflux RND transporter periplasmic adaptor subunit [Betaproteobacteria bacterium]|nr:MAG: efflux RND transporter periplasmic adaptor subunit [Betaproteobacteria bacterium]
MEGLGRDSPGHGARGSGREGRTGDRALRYRRSRSQAHRPHRRARSQPRPARAGRKAAGAESAAAQAEVHFADRVRRRGEQPFGHAGHPQVDRGAGSVGEECVNFDAPLVTVVDLAQMELQAMVPANDTPALAVGMKVALAIDGFGERRFAGTIERINPTTEAGTRAILVFIHIPNPDAALRGGMFGTGQVILVAGAPVPTLSAVAIRTEAGQTFVWTIENGKLARRIVTVGRRDDSAGRVEIKNALSPGVPVLAAPFDNLKAGAPALVRAATSPKAAGAG